MEVVDVTMFADVKMARTDNAFIMAHNSVHANHLRQISVHPSLEHIRHMKWLPNPARGLREHCKLPSTIKSIFGIFWPRKCVCWKASVFVCQMESNVWPEWTTHSHHPIFSSDFNDSHDLAW